MHQLLESARPGLPEDLGLPEDSDLVGDELLPRLRLRLARQNARLQGQLPTDVERLEVLPMIPTDAVLDGPGDGVSRYRDQPELECHSQHHDVRKLLGPQPLLANL